MTENLTTCILCGSTNIQMYDAESNLWRCQICTHVFDNPRPTPQEIENYYSRPSQYDIWHNEQGAREKLWQRRIKKVVRYASQGSLLDVGAGIGHFISIAQNYFGKVSGTEVSRTAVEYAASHYSLTLKQGQIEDIDFGDQRFNAISMFHVLEHVHNPRATLERCRELLADQGVLFIAVPNEFGTIRQGLRKFLFSVGVKKIKFKGKFGIPKIVLDGSLSEIHLSHFSANSLSTCLKELGFTVLLSDIDPYFVLNGSLQQIFASMYYRLCQTLLKVTGHNFYETTWIVARKG